MSNSELSGRSRDHIEYVVAMLNGKVDAWEVFYSFYKGLSVEAKDGEVDAMKASLSAGIGLRVIKDARTGFSFTNAFSKDALSELIDNAIKSGNGLEPDEFLTIPSSSLKPGDSLNIFDRSLTDIPEEEKIQKAIRLEKAARAFDERVTKIRKAAYSESVAARRLVNSSGIDVSDSATFVTSSIMTVAEDKGESQMGWDMGLGHFAADVDVEKIGRDAAKRAIDALGARNIKTVRCPVVLENIIVCEFLEILAPSFHADNLSKGKSMLKGKKGENVFSGDITLWDDGLLPSGWGSSFYDGEGVAKQKTCLIDKGVCANYLYDTYWAKRAGAVSTGNAARSGYRSVSGIGVSNLFINKGDITMEGLLKEMGTGLLITNILGAHTANSVTGEFSFGADGLWIEGGQAAYPVRGVAIAGNIIELFSRVAVVGGDLRFFGSIGAPSLLVSEMEISGTG